MTARRLTGADLNWAVERLAERRARLVPFAPRYWRPAPDAARVHRRFLGHVLNNGGIGYRTQDALMIAAPQHDAGWIIDDAVVQDSDWDAAGRLLWDAIAAVIADQQVRFVCPTPEPARARFAGDRGLRLSTSWWHQDLEYLPESTAEPSDPRVDGATATVVPAPPIYDPGGPVLFLTNILDPAQALQSARSEATRLNIPILVVEQPNPDRGVAAHLQAEGFHHHCDFFTGILGG